jgi:hypothetical protein
MLQLNPEKRPSVNDILAMPVMSKRLSRLLPRDVLADEFSHTVLHNQSPFDGDVHDATVLRQKMVGPAAAAPVPAPAPTRMVCFCFRFELEFIGSDITARR